jgi:hypothetical protein
MANQTRLGWRSYVVTTPVVSASTLLTSLYSVWNGDTLGTSLDTSIYGVWNADGSNNLSVKNAWNANGNANDSKGGANGTIVTPNSTTGYTTSSMTYSTGKLGTASFTFNGSNFVSLPANTFTFTSDFTVSCWFYVPTNYVSNANLLSAFDNTGSYPSYFGWWIGYDSTNKKINFSIGDSTQGSYGNVTLSTANNTITPGQWNHVMVTRKNSTRSCIYINGVLSNSNTNTTNPRYSNGWSSIGSAYFAFSQPYWTAANAGLKIDSVQTWDGVELDQTAVTELYNSGNGQEYPFTVSNALIATPNDSYGTNHGTLMNGCTFTTGKLGQAFTFDGVNDYVSLPDNSLNLTGDFSISVWVYPTAGTPQSIINNQAYANGSIYKGWGIDINNVSGGQSGKVTFTFGQGPSAGAYTGWEFRTTSLTNNAWNHIIIQRVSGVNTYCWVNGISQTYVLYGYNSNITTNPTYHTTQYNTIGASKQLSGVVSNYIANGSKVDGLTIWNKSLTEDERTQLYNLGNGTQYPFSGQTLPTSKDAYGTNNGTLMNGCTFATGKIGKAFTFDGVNDYVSLPTGAFNSLTTDFSVSAWVYLPIGYSGLDNCPIFMNMSATSWLNNAGGFWLRFAGPTIQLAIADKTNTTFFNYNTTADLLSGTWAHIVATRKSGTISKIYVNNVLKASNTDTYNPVYYTGINLTTPTIGNIKMPNGVQDSTYAFNGSKLDAVSVWNKELTSTEITELYNTGNGKQYPNY